LLARCSGKGAKRKETLGDISPHADEKFLKTLKSAEAYKRIASISETLLFGCRDEGLEGG
jgi:hypothetical protein